MSRPEIRQNLSPSPNPGRWENFRLADYLLRQHNLSIPQTPSDETQAPNWMRSGFALFYRLEALGYQLYPQAGAERQCLEVYPHASYAVMLGVLPFPKHSLEGRLQRQLALYDHKVDVPDAMRFFEEITRHRLLKGVLSLEMVYSPGELDALVAAYTAWLAALHPEQVTRLGDPEEGQVILPGVELKTRY
jgi:predicted RNase H-like nuclease